MFALNFCTELVADRYQKFPVTVSEELPNHTHKANMGHTHVTEAQAHNTPCR